MNVRVGYRFMGARTWLLSILVIYFLLASILYCYFNNMQMLLETAASYGNFFFLGLGGAIVANATGAGGGIVFIPAFSSLGLSQSEMLSTSILIQCFGMTAGSISWLFSLKQRTAIFRRYRLFLVKAIGSAGLASIAGALASQLWLRSEVLDMLQIFSVLTIFFGLILLYSNLNPTEQNFPKAALTQVDYALIIPICFVGGVITSIISIGVGEILLILLFLRKYPLHIAIFVAVCVSAITVIACAPYQIIVEKAVVWDIVAFAAPAAILGGVAGRYFALLLGASRIKIFCAVWILVTGIMI